MRNPTWRAWLGLSPALAIMTFVGVLPLSIVFHHSFYDLFTLESKFWVGGEWYVEILTSSRFYESLGRSLAFSMIILCVQFPLGLLIALSLPKAGPMKSVMLILLALPLVVPWNMIPAIWLSLVNPDTGLIGGFVAIVDVPFDYKFTALHTWVLIVVVDTWHWVGLVAILSYAGLSGIPPGFYQAAAIDQARRWQVFFYIELPRMRAVLLMALLLRFMDSFMIYTEAFGINAGGPMNATAFLSLDLGEQIAAFNYGPAAARSIIYFAITLCVVFVFVRAMKRQRNATAGAPR
jgi:glycerol transport system permease protein